MDRVLHLQLILPCAALLNLFGPIVIDLRGFAFEDCKMYKILIAILALTIPLTIIAAEGFSSLEEQMTGKEYTASGLNKLTPEELDALNNWIRSHSIATLDQPKAGSYAATPGTDEDNRGFEDKEMAKMDRSMVTSRIKGSFTGWDGSTVFELENGMIWEQVDKDTFYIREVENPEVTIDPGAFHTWRLSVTGYSSECRVERIQ
jgi:hypothetical protein